MIKGIHRFSFILILTFLLLFLSCGRNTVYTDSRVMDGETWKLMNIPTFMVSITDTLTSNNVTFNIRSSSSYPFRNIFLFVTTTSPDGSKLTDTLQYNLADEKGNWYGRGVGDIHELSLPYKSNVYFPLKGAYEFKIQHGMRVEDLKGVYDFGVKITKVRK